MLKTLFAIGALSLAWSCSDDSSSFNTNNPPPVTTPHALACAPSWHLLSTINYVIYPDNVVTDDMGNILGTMSWLPAPYDTVGKILDLNNNVIVQQVNKNALPVLMGEDLSPVYTIRDDAVYHLKLNATFDVLISPTNIIYDAAGNAIATYDPATGAIISIIDGTTLATYPPENVKTLPVINQFNKCAIYDPPPSSSSVTPTSSATPIASSATIPPIPTSSAIVPLSSASQPKSSATPKSSASQPKSSSSQPKSSAATGGCPNIKVVNGGAKGSGWATRYWDCCKPSCSWQENSGGNPSRQCGSNGKNESTDWGAGSVCSGGPMATCTSQIPFTVSGCDEYGFAFAAVPAANGGQCGKCFQLAFDGTGKYSNASNIKKLKGKKLIIMVTNIGGDVNQGQFDVMIPGGGVGMFNGCSSMGWGAQGEQYGGLLSDCEKETSYSAGKYASCLTEKCNSVFKNDSEAKKGCLFLADWMGGASNPNHNYQEVECPDVLKKKY